MSKPNNKPNVIDIPDKEQIQQRDSSKYTILVIKKKFC